MREQPHLRGNRAIRNRLLGQAQLLVYLQCPRLHTNRFGKLCDALVFLNNYKLDSTNSATLTRTQLVAKISSGDKVTIIGVSPGAGQRMGIDRNLNGVLDADEPRPTLQIAHAAGQAVIKWPFSGVGVLEESASLNPATWTNNTNAVEIANGFNFVTNSPGAAVKFFRLRQQ